MSFDTKNHLTAWISAEYIGADYTTIYQTPLWLYAIVLLLGIAGLANNIANVVVFTRRNMITPSNLILTGVSMADLIVVLLLLMLTTVLVFEVPVGQSIVYWMFSNFYIFISISIWLTALLAIWQYLAVAHPVRSRDWCNWRNTFIAVVLVYILCLILYILSMFSGVRNDTWSLTENTAIVFAPQLMDTLASTGCIGSVALVVMTLKLICKLREVRKRQHRLQQDHLKTDRKMKRTIALLLARLFLFLISALSLKLPVLFAFTYCTVCRAHLQNPILLVSVAILINTASTFPICYFMSNQFRVTFNNLLKSRPPARLTTASSEEL